MSYSSEFICMTEYAFNNLTLEDFVAFSKEKSKKILNWKEFQNNRFTISQFDSEDYTKVIRNDFNEWILSSDPGRFLVVREEKFWYFYLFSENLPLESGGCFTNQCHIKFKRRGNKIHFHIKFHRIDSGRFMDGRQIERIVEQVHALHPPENIALTSSIYQSRYSPVSGSFFGIGLGGWLKGDFIPKDIIGDCFVHRHLGNGTLIVPAESYYSLNNGKINFSSEQFKKAQRVEIALSVNDLLYDRQ